MKTVISAACVLAWAFSLDAQITTTLNRLPDGSTQFRTTNNTAVDLTAFAISVNETNGVIEGGRLIVYGDSAIDTASAPVLPHQQGLVEAGLCVMPLNGKEACTAFEQPIVTAGIFADGSTTGDAALLYQLVLRRRNMLQAVEIALEMVTDAGRHNVPRDQLVERFKKMADSASRWYLLPEQQIGSGIYQSIVGKLMNLPEEQVGSPFPPATFVAGETAMLNRQRVALLESQPSLADATVIGSLSNR